MARAMKGGDAKVVMAIMVGLVVAMVMAKPSHGAIDCNHMESLVVPCSQYIIGGATKPSPACCDGVRALKKEAPTMVDRRATCECLINAASHIPGIRKDLAAALPKECGVDLGIPVSPSTKCNDIK